MIYERCEHCGGRLDRPGLYSCGPSYGHPEPSIPQRIVWAIERELDDRRGFRIDTLDDEIADDLRDKLVQIVAVEIEDLLP